MSGRGGRRVSTVKSSLPYQLLLYSNAWYYLLYFIAEVVIFIYKGQVLPYPKRNLVPEILLLLAISLIEIIRNYCGQKGNLTESMSNVGASMVLSVPAIATFLYLLLWQTYVLRIEVILNAIQLVFVLLEIIFAIVAVATFARASPI